MTRVIWRPHTHRPEPEWRIAIGWRFAFMYPEGTRIQDNRGVVWRSWRDHADDSLPMWSRDDDWEGGEYEPPRI